MNKIIKILIASDFLISTGWGLLNPIFAIFITEKIIGGTLAVVGIAEFIFLSSKAFFQLIFGDYLDIESSDRRNLRWALIGSIILNLSVLLYLVCRYPWHLYSVELLVGISSAMIYPSWYDLFVKHLNPRRRAFSISFHSTAIEGGSALSAAIGGLIANYFGFSFLIYLVAGISLIGTIFLFFLIRPILIFEQKERAESKIDSLPVVAPPQALEIKPEILTIRKYGDPILRDHAKPIREIDETVRRLAQEMLITMYKNGGCGLAAPQVGELVKLIIVDIGEGPLILANPKILKKSWYRIWAEEGCLSLPGIVLKLKRPKKIEVEGFQINNGQRIKIRAKGLLARALIHEIEHLDGILIIDKLTFWQKWFIRRQLKELKRNTQELLREKQKAKLLAKKEKLRVPEKAERLKESPSEVATKKAKVLQNETKALMKIEPPPEQTK
ncbi:MAG: peptide deformylase [Patescibacteria group bacterium]